VIPGLCDSAPHTKPSSRDRRASWPGDTEDEGPQRTIPGMKNQGTTGPLGRHPGLANGLKASYLPSFLAMDKGQNTGKRHFQGALLILEVSCTFLWGFPPPMRVLRVVS
jgi:hypothetical protein